MKKKTAKPSRPKKTAIIWTIAGAVLLVFVALYMTLRLFSGAGRATQALPPLPPGAIPQIVSAAITPERPQANTALTAEFQARGPEGNPVQCTFRWLVNDSVIQEGPSAVLAAGSVKKGEAVSLEIVPSASTGQGRPFKAGPVRIANTPPSVTSISMTPSQPAPGALVTAAVAGEDADRDQVIFRYQWTVNGQPAGTVPQDGVTFDTTGLKKKDGIAVTITPFDGEESGKPVLSDVVVLMNSAPRITSTPPTALENGIYSYQVMASDPDGDRLRYSLEKAPEGMSIDASTGLVRWQPAATTTSGRQEIPVKIKADDNDGGAVYQEYSLFLEVQ